MGHLSRKQVPMKEVRGKKCMHVWTKVKTRLENAEKHWKVRLELI